MRILVAVDLTEEDAQPFVGQATTWVRVVGGTADLVFVDESASENPWILDASLRQTMSSHYEAWAEQMAERLDALRDALPREVRGEARVVKGRPAAVLLELLEAEYDAIIVGNRPATGLSRLAHGVVAERVCRQAQKPVVVLPRG
jgi:nucleotide-binding universal stress UspA family protein